jgi:MFS family permease
MISIDEGYVESAAPNSGWTVIAATGAVTVLSFAILAEYFPQEVSGRANAALNLLHVGAAFVLQSAMGIIIAQWPLTNGGYAVAAHEAAMTAGICVQLLALGWFALPDAGRYWQPSKSTGSIPLQDLDIRR